MLKYYMIEESCTIKLAREVNEFVNNCGFELYGNPFAISRGNYGETTYCQAVIKHKD